MRMLGDDVHLPIRERSPHQQRVLRNLAQLRKHVICANLAKPPHHFGRCGRRLGLVFHHCACRTSLEFCPDTKLLPKCRYTTQNAAWYHVKSTKEALQGLAQKVCNNHTKVSRDRRQNYTQSQASAREKRHVHHTNRSLHAACWIAGRESAPALRSLPQHPALPCKLVTSHRGFNTWGGKCSTECTKLQARLACGAAQAVQLLSVDLCLKLRHLQELHLHVSLLFWCHEDTFSVGSHMDSSSTNAPAQSRGAKQRCFAHGPHKSFFPSPFHPLFTSNQPIDNDA